MSGTLTEKLIAHHLEDGIPGRGEEIALHIDQTLTQDATGTLVMLELEAMQLDRAQTDVSVQYVDHNLLQQDFRNAEDHLFLKSACERFGLWYSRPGNGVSHPLHQEHFGKPGATLLGSDSHTCAAGALGMLAIGAGGLEVAMAIAGQPYRLPMPEVWGVYLEGEMPEWVSAKDIILEMLRRHSVKGGVGRVIEYYGPGLDQLSVMDRHVIANMGAELGATATVFPADELVRKYLARLGREEDYAEWLPDKDAAYSHDDTIVLNELEPLMAMPSSPDNVVPVREVAGKPLYQAYIGSSANPGYRDFAMAARMVAGHHTPPAISLDVNPTSRQLLEELARDLHLNSLLHAGARIHQAGCNGCIGMGQAPARGKLSLRTVPRNFSGRSGTPDDQVCLCSPETAVASAIKGVITDPRDLGIPYPHIEDVEKPVVNKAVFLPPREEDGAETVELVKGDNIVSIPELDALPDTLDIPVALKVGDNVSTDEIMPAGTRVLPYRSNIPKIAEFVYEQVDPTYHDRALACRENGGHVILGGRNYGQGSSREHAALAPRYLGLRIVLAQSFARIHLQNLVNWGIIPLTIDEADYTMIDSGTTIQVRDVHNQLASGSVTLHLDHNGHEIHGQHNLSGRQLEVLCAGGTINWQRKQQEATLATA
jgi:aconitate hydratase